MRIRLLTAVLTLFVGASPLLAQRPLTIGLGGGASLPTGDFGKGAGAGWHALAVVGLESIFLPQSLRADIGYAVFPFKDVGSVDADGSSTIGSATLNFAYRLPMTNSPLSPYVITGFGWYQLGCRDCESTIRSGWNAGLGTKFNMGLRGFIETRFHSINASGGKIRFVPLTVGVRL